MAKARGCIATCAGGILIVSEFLVPCSPVSSHSRSESHTACPPLLSPMHLLRIRSRSQKQPDRSQDSNTASTSSSRPPLVPQTNLTLSTPEDTLSLPDNSDVSALIGRKISHFEPDDPK